MRLSEIEFQDLINRKNNALKTAGRPVTTTPLEDQEQMALVSWLKMKGIRHFSIPNGGLRNKVIAGKLKAQGVVPGVPDLTIWPPPNCPSMPVLFIEMKRIKGGTVSEFQQEWLDYFCTLEQQGYPFRAAVCRGFDQARQFIESWGY